MIWLLRRIAHHEARQLRRYPPRLWPLVAQETRAARLLLAAHGRPVTCAPLNVESNVRVP